MHEHGALDDGLVARHREPRGQVLVGADFADLHTAEDLEPAPVREVHEDHRDAIVPGGVADGHVLAVAAEVGPGEGALVEHTQKARRTAARLNVMPARFADAREVEAVAGRDELALLGAEPIVSGLFLGEARVAGA